MGSGLDLASLFISILNGMQQLSNWFRDEGAFWAVALVVVSAAVRVAVVAWEQGGDYASMMFRQRLGYLILTVALCLPSPLFKGESFMTWYPKAVVSGGLRTADVLVAKGGLGVWGKSAVGEDSMHPLMYLPSKLEQTLSSRAHDLTFSESMKKWWAQAKTWWKNRNNYVKDASGWSSIFGSQFVASLKLLAGFSLSLIVLLPLLLLFVPLMAIPSVGPVLFGGVAAVLGLTAVGIGMNFAYGLGYNPVTGLINSFFQTFTNLLAGGLFIGIVTFSFYGVLLSCLARGVIYTITFPFTIVHMAFDTQRPVFRGHVVKGLQIAFTPVVAAVCFAVACQVFTAVYNSGFFEKVMSSVNIPPTEVNTFSFVVYVMKSLTMVFFCGGLMALPFSKYILQAKNIAAELIGQGYQFASGLSERAAGIFGRAAGA